MYFLKVPILKHSAINPKFFKIELVAPSIAQIARPGQFIKIRVGDTLSPLLPRPMSLAKIDKEKECITIIYKIRGLATQLLSQKKEGQKVEILGPLGKPYHLLFEAKTIVLIGGGCGIASILGLAWAVSDKTGIKKIAILGAKDKKLIIGQDDFKKLGYEIFTTDIKQGEVFKRLVKKIKIDQVFCCAHKKTIMSVIETSKENQIPCQVSLEEIIACGLGACLGCVIKIKNQKSKIKNQKDFEYQRVCMEGPVFEGEKVIFG